jgi:hypothetical protein
MDQCASTWYSGGLRMGFTNVRLLGWVRSAKVCATEYCASICSNAQSFDVGSILAFNVYVTNIKSTHIYMETFILEFSRMRMSEYT